MQQMWISKPVGDGVWLIAYRIDTLHQAPYVAEVRVRPISSPPWGELPPNEVPGVEPNLDSARRALSPSQALRIYHETSEPVDDETNGHLLQPLPRLHGYDRTAPARARPDDPYFAGVAQLYLAIKRKTPGSYSRRLIRELGLPPNTSARKVVWNCRQRELLKDDELTPYARGLLDASA